MFVPVKKTDAPVPSAGMITSTVPPEPASVLPSIPGIASMSIDAMVYPLPGSVTAALVRVPDPTSSSTSTVMVHLAPSPSPAIGTS